MPPRAPSTARVWALRPDQLGEVNFEGSVQGIQDAVDWVGANGVIWVGPGAEKYTIPSLPSGVVLHRYETGQLVTYGTTAFRGAPWRDVRAYGAKGDGVTNDSAAINAAIAAASAGSSVFFPGGTYLALGLAGKSGVSLIGQGATLKKTGGGVDTHVLNLTGTESATSANLTANAAVGDVTVSVASSSGFAAGDYVLVRDSTYKYSTFGRNQELNRVASTTGTTITLRNRLIAAYATASTAQIVKINAMANITIQGITFELEVGTNTGGAFYGTLCYGVRIMDCTALYPNDDPGFYFNQSARCRLVECTVRDAQSVGAGGFGYGILFDESQHCHATGCITEAVRENLMTNNSRYCSFNDCTDTGSETSSFNTHGSGNENCAIVNCYSISAKANGIGVGFGTHDAGDKWISVIGNHVVNAGNHGIVASAANTLENTDVLIEGNVITGFGIVTASANGIQVQQTTHAKVIGNQVDGLAGANALACIYALNLEDALINANSVRNASRGIQWFNVLTTIITGNKIHGMSGLNLNAVGGGTNTVTLQRNTTDDTSKTLDGTEVLGGNTYGATFDDNQGTATVANGTTSIAVTHNLGTTPMLDDISVTPTNNMGTAAEFWISTPTSTQFTINVNADPGATTATFVWQAHVK